MTSPRQDSRLGTNLGPYRIERIIGRGGMGVVYLAEQRELGRKVALKLLAPEYADDEAFRARFLRESRAAASIDHANIIPIYEAGEVDGTYYLAMRYVEGTDLDARLKVGPLDPDVAVDMLAQAASALDAAHAAGLIHRDVKPANLLLADEGGGIPHVYLTDFGLTKRRQSRSGLTRAGSTLGTLEYMAPEQVEGRDVDAPADEYALAGVAFHCLTGRVPFVRESDVAVAMAHLRDAPPSAVALRPALPAGVDAVLARGMAKDPSTRYETCAALVVDLRRALDGGAITAPSVPVQPASRRPLAVATLVVIVLLAIGGLVLGSAIGGLGPGRPSPSASSVGALPRSTNGAPTPTSSSFPNPEEAELVAALPGHLQDACVRGSMADVSGPRGSSGPPIASVLCTQGNFAFQAKRLDPSVVQAKEVIALDATERRLPAGDCEVAAPATGVWRQGSREMGTATCYQDGISSVIEWTYDDEDLLVRAAFPYGDARFVASWWLDVRDLVGPNVGEAPFPSTAEAALVGRLPIGLRQDCRRGSYGRIANSAPVRPIASISCPQAPGSGANSLEVRQISAFEALTASQVVEAVTGSIGGCPPPARADGRWSIGARDIGAIVCYSDQHPTSVVDWSYDSDQIIARARRSDERPDLLYDWWLANAATFGATP